MPNTEHLKVKNFLLTYNAPKAQLLDYILCASQTLYFRFLVQTLGGYAESRTAEATPLVFFVAMSMIRGPRVSPYFE